MAKIQSGLWLWMGIGVFWVTWLIRDSDYRTGLRAINIMNSQLAVGVKGLRYKEISPAGVSGLAVVFPDCCNTETMTANVTMSKAPIFSAASFPDLPSLVDSNLLHFHLLIIFLPLFSLLSLSFCVSNVNSSYSSLVPILQSIREVYNVAKRDRKCYLFFLVSLGYPLDILISFTYSLSLSLSLSFFFFLPIRYLKTTHLI